MKYAKFDMRKIEVLARGFKPKKSDVEIDKEKQRVTIKTKYPIGAKARIVIDLLEDNCVNFELFTKDGMSYDNCKIDNMELLYDWLLTYCI